MLTAAVQQKINHLELAARQAEAEYKSHIKLVNENVDQIRGEYRTRLNRV